MKRFVLLLSVCLCLVALLAGCKKKTNYVPEVIPTHSNIAQEVQLTLVDDTEKVWLDNSHFVSVEVKTDEDGVAYLEFVTTEEGKALLKQATEENLNKPLTFVADKKFLFSPAVTTVIENGVFAVGNPKTYDAQYIFNMLTASEDPMLGVRPPSYVLEASQVKKIAYEKAGITEDQVLGVTCSLKFNTDWRGWEYTIEFIVEGRQHTCVINAVTGTVTRYAK